MGRKWTRWRSLTARQRRVVAVSVLLLPGVELSLHRRGFDITSRSLAARSQRLAGTADLDDARLVADAVALVAGQPRVGAQCLGRSLVVWFLLRRQGTDADLVIGTQATDAGQITAHAWVEVLGVPVNDAANVREIYGSFGVRLPKLGALA